MGYSESSSSVRVDYFKPSGKWYMTEAVEMGGLYDMLDIHEAVRVALRAHWRKTRNAQRVDSWEQFTVVVLKPYHRNAYPIMIVAQP